MSPSVPATGDPHSLAVAQVLAELRSRMGADLVWFGRICDVPADPGGMQRLCWSGIWADGPESAARGLHELDDQPVLGPAHLDLAQPPLAWQTSTYMPGAKGFWSQTFARHFYLLHDLHEEHRLLLRDDNNLLGVVAALWDRRRTGVVHRLPQAQRDNHARWTQERLRQVLRHPGLSAPQPAGEVVLSAQHGVLFASGPALGWLDDHRAARLHAAVTRATRAVPAKTAAQCVAGAHVQLTRLTGPQGTAWLAHLQPTRAVEAAMPALLTPSQAEVIEWVLAGCTAVEIAGRLNKGVETVRSQIKQAYVRLGVRNRLELARTMPRRPV